MKKNKNWWKYGIFYHIYVRSFFDSNGDGVGDIPGVTAKLDYLADLGISAIWLSPIFKSPMVDFGYDISDYLKIDPVYGTIKDLAVLINEAHSRNIRVILDIALNHTSDQHPWFLESRSSLENPKRDWYIWRKGRWAGPPNNWITGMFESAWKYDKKTDEYYLHSFLRHQPDLNWRNKKVQKVMLNVLQKWLEFGIDGFRLDMVNWLVKDKKMRSNPNFLFFKIFQRQIYNKNQKKISPLLEKIRKTTDQYKNRVTIGEVFTMPPGDPKLSAYFLGNGRNSLNLAFDFSLMYRIWNARIIFKTVERWIQAIPDGGWPCHVFSNHDQKRSFTRLCKGRDGYQKYKLLAMLHLTLPGTPFVYYGEEIGMKNFHLAKNEIKDPLGLKFWPFFKGRDSSRSPMQWDSSQNSGFSLAKKTWLPVNPEYTFSNVKTQKKEEGSLLNEYKTIIKLRNKNPAFFKGRWEPVHKGKNGLVAYWRIFKNDRLLVVLNFRNKKIDINMLSPGKFKLIYSTVPRSGKDPLILSPYEGLILQF